MTRPLTRWLLMLALAGATVAPPAAACAAPAEPGLHTACCCSPADGACHMACADAPDIQPTMAAAAPPVPMMLAALPHAPQAFLAAHPPASCLDIQAPAAIPKHCLRTHPLRL